METLEADSLRGSLLLKGCSFNGYVNIVSDVFLKFVRRDKNRHKMLTHSNEAINVYSSSDLFFRYILSSFHCRLF